VVELENKDDTTAWLRNQERAAAQERVELPGDIPLIGGPVSASGSTPRSANTLPLSPVSPRQRTPVEMTPNITTLDITPPEDAERRLGDAANDQH
jgi:hypothetical protein